MILGFTGYKGSGKDTAAQFDAYVRIYKFADPLKDMLRTFLKLRGADTEHIERMIEGDLKEEPSYFLNEQTPRWAMQSLGTEWGRNLIDGDLWMDTMKDRLVAVKKDHVVAVTDIRFVNEAKLIFALGGKIIRITRPGMEIPAVAHQSEAEMKLIIPSTTILNDGTIEELHIKVRSYVERLRSGDQTRN